jgi:hypothetical protein
MSSVYLNTVLIPSARYVEPEMQLEVGRVPPVLILVNGKPILELIVESYATLLGNTRFVICAHEGIEKIQEYVERRMMTSVVSVVDVGQTEDLAETIGYAMELLGSDFSGNIYINFGDTVINAPLELDTDAVYYDSVPESYRWATFRREEDDLIIIDRFNSDSISFQSVFAGVFLLKDSKLFLRCLTLASAAPKLGRFYVALKEYLHGRMVEFIKVNDWFDFGHVDNYFSSKKNFINKRFFNQIKIDEYRAIVEKRSRHTQKFYGEIKWYLEMPADLRCYLPQVYNHALSGDDSFIQLEYYGYPALSEIYLIGGHSLSIWNHALEAIFRLLSEMQAYRVRVKPEELRAAVRSMYVAKTMDRLRIAAEIPELKCFFENSVVINGKTYSSLWVQLEDLPDLVERYLTLSLSEMSIIHGDACLSNILFDPKSRIIKLIDPRGQFGNQTIYGDFRYDLAKLSHSFHGFYELILSDSFELNYAEGALEWRILKSEQQNKLSETFERRLMSSFAEQVSQIRLIEALLFLSMAPLHKDAPRRQMVMLATGIEQLNEAVATLRASV